MNKLPKYNKMNIVQLTTVHSRSDTRIFIKEAQTIASHTPYKVTLIVADGKGNVDKNNNQVSIYDLGNLGSNRLSRMVKGFIRGFGAVRRLNPIIIHFHDPELIILGLFLKLFGYIVIYDIHEDVPQQTLSKHYIPILLRKPTAWAITVVELVGTFFFNAIIPATPKIARRFPSNKIATIQNFPIQSELINDTTIPYLHRSFSFVYVGSIAEIRGSAEMIEAISLLDNKSAKLIFAGTFSPQALHNKSEKIKGWKLVHYKGHVTRSELAKLLGASRAGLVLFHPLPNHIDSQPNKMFEYMSAGLPVIASDFPLWREIIEGTGCGLLVDPMDPRSIANAMSWIITHPVEAEEMGRRGQQSIKNLYNWNKESIKLISIYERLVSNARN